MSAGPKVRWGILGAGGIARTVGADIAASPASLVGAVASRDAARATHLAAALGADRAYGTHEALVADPDVDVVYVATTHTQHHDAALPALRAGKPVLVEKPLGVNARQARDIQAEATASGLLCLEGHVAAAQTYGPGSLGGGALLDLGVYAAAFVLPLIGRPSNVRAAGSLAPTGGDVSVALTWTSTTGQVATLTCSSITEGDSAATIIDSRLMPLADSLEVLEVLDEARRQLGVRYQADEEN